MIKFFDPNQNKKMLMNTDENGCFSKNKILNPLEIRDNRREEEKMLKHFLSEVKQALLNINNTNAREFHPANRSILAPPDHQ